MLSPGQDHDLTCAQPLIEAVDPGALIADKAFDADAFIAALNDRAIVPVIPSKSNRKTPRPCDFALYCERNLVERFFNKLKHFRAIATRYDKLAKIFLAAVHLACAAIRRRRDAGEDRSRAEGSGMIFPSSGVKVLIAMKPVDFRKGMDGLAAVVHETLGANPFGGVIYVLRSKRADRVKLLFWDGTGLVLATKRLEQGSFRWPSLREGVMRLTPGQLVALLDHAC